jgi:hypothetical protein
MGAGTFLHSPVLPVVVVPKTMLCLHGANCLKDCTQTSNTYTPSQQHIGDERHAAVGDCAHTTTGCVGGVQSSSTGWVTHSQRRRICPPAQHGGGTPQGHKEKDATVKPQGREKRGGGLGVGVVRWVAGDRNWVALETHATPPLPPCWRHTPQLRVSAVKHKYPRQPSTHSAAA